MAQIVFTKGGDTFTFVDGRSFPVDDPATVNVVVGYSDGRQVYAYDKGIEESEIVLNLQDICETDFDNLLDWHKNVCVGPKETFTFTDESSVDHTVRWMDVRFPLRRTGPVTYSGTVRLREEVS